MQVYRRLVSVCVQMFSIMECHQPTRVGKRLTRSRSVACTVVSRRSICGRAMELVNGHESFLAPSTRGAHSILDSSFNFARASYFVAG